MVAGIKPVLAVEKPSTSFSLSDTYIRRTCTTKPNGVVETFTSALGTASDSTKQNILPKERGCTVIDIDNYTALGRTVMELKIENETLKEKLRSMESSFNKLKEREKAHLEEIAFQRKVIDHLISTQ